MPPEIWLMIPAAGSGSRMQAQIPKQYLTLNGRTLLDASLDRVMHIPHLKACVLALSAEDESFAKSEWSKRKNLYTVVGGESRAESVLAGLKEIQARAEKSAWVLVHDAARPCVNLEKIQQLIDACISENCGGILAAPATDTIKRSQDSVSIDTTEDRSQLWHAHTPQFFPLDLLQDALERALRSGANITDEASAIEWAGERVILIPDSRDNIKVTLPEDLAWAEFILEKQKP